jgi:3-isopropylmalate/(R)-2-methylmalate dehydratase small subunit
MQAQGLSIICASMPGKMIRRAVARSIPVMIAGTQSQGLAATGDEVEVDFATGEFRNLRSGLHVGLPRMPAMLCEIVAGGGAEAALRAWLERHPEQALAAPGNLWKSTNN